jgi:hypothetical protein
VLNTILPQNTLQFALVLFLFHLFVYIRNPSVSIFSLSRRAALSVVGHYIPSKSSENTIKRVNLSGMSKTPKQQKFADLLTSIDDKLQTVGLDYVKRGLFGTMLRAWAVNGTKITTNPRTRKKVETYIHTDRASMYTMETQIVLTALLLTSPRNDEYRNRTQDHRTTLITTDVHFRNNLEYCLDYMTILVQAGAELKQAWQHVLACVKKISTGVWILNSELFQAKKAEVDAEDTHSPHARIKVLLDTMKKIIADYEKNNGY